MCHAALERLGAASAKQIKEFWEATQIDEVKDWIDRASLKIVKWQSADKQWHEAYVAEDFSRTVK